MSEYPRYRLVQDIKAKLAKTLGTNRGIITDIISHDKNKYKVKYDDGTTDKIPMRNLREGRPTRLSPLELQYWRRHKNNLPKSIKAYLVM